MSGWCRVIEAAVDGGTEGVVQEVWGWTLVPCQHFLRVRLAGGDPWSTHRDFAPKCL